MKKVFGYVLSLALAVMLIVAPADSVFAQGLGLSVSAGSVSVGKTVKVTVSMPSGYFGTVVVSSSDEGVLSNGGDGVANIGDAASMPTSQSFTFTAKSAGTCTIKAYCTVVGDAEGNDAGGSISGASTTVTVTAGSSGTSSSGQSGNNGGSSNAGSSSNNDNNSAGDNNAQKPEEKELEKSSNSSLSSLVISSGSLSPEFSAGTRDYTATVDYSVSSLAVTATPADQKASVTSVTGNDSLEVGENTVSVVVTAENGATSTYNIVVTRRAEDDPENSDQQENWKKFDIGGTEWTMVNDIPEDVIPEGFEHSKTIIDGLEYNTLQADFGDITLVFLQSDGGSSLFVYDAAQNAAYEYVRINSESHFIVILLPDVNDVPEGYNEVSLSIEGKGVATAYQSKDENADKDFYLVYAMNDSGECGWYTYDSVDGTYIRSDVTAPTIAQEEEKAENETIPGIEKRYLIVAAVLVIIIVILLIILIVTIIRGRKNRNVRYIDEDDDEEYDVSDTDTDPENGYIESDYIDNDEQDDSMQADNAPNDDMQDDSTPNDISDVMPDNAELQDDAESQDHEEEHPVVDADNDEAVSTDETDDADNTDTIDDEYIEKSEETTEDIKATDVMDVEDSEGSDASVENVSDVASTDNDEAAETDETEELEKIDISDIVRRTVEIKTENESATEAESLENKVQKAIDDFSNKTNDDDTDDDLEFVDLN